MCHQPFEKWIFEKDELSLKDQKELRLHLEECPECKDLYLSLHSAEGVIKKAPMISPSASFSARWQKLAEERKYRQVLQLRRFFLFLGAANFITLAAFFLIAILTDSSVKWIMNTFMRFGELMIWWENLRQFALSIFQLFPPYIPLAVWITITSGFFTLTLIWLTSLWRISTQGVKVK